MKMLPGNGACIPLKRALSLKGKKWLPALFPFPSRSLPVPFRKKTVFSGNSGEIAQVIFSLPSRPLPARVVYAFVETNQDIQNEVVIKSIRPKYVILAKV